MNGDGWVSRGRLALIDQLRFHEVLLTGSYRRNLDDKQRLAIPKQLRDALGFPENNTLFIAPGNDRALVIYTAEVLEQIGKALSKLSPAARETRDFSPVLCSVATCGGRPTRQVTHSARIS